MDPAADGRWTASRSSSELLGERTIVINAHAVSLPAGTIVANNAYVQQAVTNKAPRPRNLTAFEGHRRADSKARWVTFWGKNVIITLRLAGEER